MALLFAFEGIDGTGKGTQARLLRQNLEGLGLRVRTVSFPDYESFLGREIGQLLSGKQQTTAAELDPKSMALWFASERWHTFNQVELDKFDVVIFDRYVLSNAIYQGVRVRREERKATAFLNWIFELEHNVFNLPHPNITFVLDVDEAQSAKNVWQKGHRAYTGYKPDVYESSEMLQKVARESYRELAMVLSSKIQLIQCMESDGTMRQKDDIAAEVLGHCKDLLPK